MNVGTYTIEVDEERKLVKIVVVGTFDDKKAGEFHQDYLKTVYPLQTEDYLLLANGVDMDVITMDMLPKLQMSFAFYKKSKFKEICFIIVNDEVRKQVLKLIRFSGITDITDITFMIPEEVDAKIEAHQNRN